MTSLFTRLRRLLAIASTAVLSLTAQAYTNLPVDGVWSITSEQSLAIGRAFVLETQGSVTAVTFYNYNTAGAPTFYVGAGSLSAADTISLTFNEPRGGTCLGCSPTSGALLSTPGAALFEFTSATTGYVTLPREARKAIFKGNFAWPEAPSGLLGGWLFGYLTTATGYTGNGLAMNAQRTIGCEYSISGAFQGKVTCVTIEGFLSKFIVGKLWGNQFDGEWSYDNSLTVKHRFVARRFISTNGDVGVIKGATEIAPTGFENEDALRAAIQRAEAVFAAP
jgi:hypothetical protein